jgi:hypothetical protein
MQVTRYFSNRERDESIYQYFPFDVPAGVDGVVVQMRHDGKASVVDLGLFDPQGFRGWSGSERDWVAVSKREATPGYLPGDIPSGTWFVSIGLHQIEDAGINVNVTVEFGSPKFPKLAPPPNPKTVARRRQLRAPKGWRWVSADFHSHSVHSDGSLTLEELAGLAKEQGLELLAITDHNTISHHAHLPEVSRRYGINLLPGQEVTTASGHANSFGKIDWVDYRQATEKWLSDTNSRGGLLSINHPVAYPCHWDRDVPADLKFSELWHSSWDRKSRDPFLWWEENGRPIPIGGSDFHRLGRDGLPGQPTTWILTQTENFEITQSEIFEALRHGRVAISAGTDSPVVHILEDAICVDQGEGCILTMPSGEKRSINSSQVEFKGEPGLYSLESDDGITQALGYIH